MKNAFAILFIPESLEDIPEMATIYYDSDENNRLNLLEEHLYIMQELTPLHLNEWKQELNKKGYTVFTYHNIDTIEVSESVIFNGYIVTKI